MSTLYLALVFGVFAHSLRKKTEVEIADIRAIPLEEGILLKEAIELVSSDLSFEEYIFGVFICELLYFISYRIGKNPLTSTEFDID